MSANAKENQLISDFCKSCDCNRHSRTASGRIDQVSCQGKPGKKIHTIAALIEFINQNSTGCPYKTTRCLSAGKMNIAANFKEADLKKAVVTLNCAACNFYCQEANLPCSIEKHDPRNMIGMKRQQIPCPDHSSRHNKVRS